MLGRTEAEVFSLFRGKWTFYRKIYDYITHNQAYSRGSAFFYPLKSGKKEHIYVEHVDIYWNNRRKYKAFNQFKYLLQDNILSKYRYSINRNYSQLPMEKMYDLIFSPSHGVLTANGQFLCGKDLYSACYIFDSLRKFCLRYQAKGVKKDFTISSVFHKSF